MISSRYTLGGLAVVVASSFIPMSSAHANGCEWKNGVTGPIPYSIDLGTHYVPRDVPRSTPIGPIDAFFIRNGQGRSIDCYTLGPQIDFKSRNNLPLVPGNFIISGEDSTGKIIKTNVDGVGVRVKLGPPYTTGWTPVGSSVAVVPYEAYVARYLPFGLIHSLLQPNITLVKTGDIAPGIHLLNVSNLLEGWFTGVGTGFNLSLTGTVIQAECSVSANPVSADPVDLGAWNLSDFTAIGDKTTAEPFTITLNSCMTDDRTPPQTVTYAHIRLDPTAGSTIHDAATGQFTLGTGSTAKGVVIQILHDDETPIPLASAVKLKPISPGTTTLNLKARLYQTAPPGPGLLEPGLAKGSLNFTITYL